MRRCTGFIALALIPLAGCASIETPLDDGYQYGDLAAAREAYCENANPYRRAVLLALMHRAGVDLPDNGACTDILEMINAGDTDATRRNTAGTE